MTDTRIDFNNAKVLIVDDMPANIDVLLAVLEHEPYNILVATSGASALKVAATERPDLILLDVVMPNMDGYETCRRLKSTDDTKDIPVIFLTTRDDVEGVMEGFRSGAIDYVTKPFHKEEVLARIRTHLERALLVRHIMEQNLVLESEISRRKALDNRLTLITQREAEHWGVDGFIGKSESIQKILHDINLLKNANTVSVLITGESGTGKELIARAVHAGSNRSKGPFVPLNCATIPTELAHEGTLFLDEIGTMPQELQSKLLRVLEDGMIRPLGTTSDRFVDVRIIAATNEAVDLLREDLYFRLARFRVEMPPLRDRQEDIPLLALHFIQLFSHEMGMEPPALHAEALIWLNLYPFPGNVRELKNIVERALIESGGAEIKRQHLHGHQLPPQASPLSTSEYISADDLPLNLDEALLILVERILEQTNGNVTQAANLLGVDRNKIYRIQARKK